MVNLKDRLNKHLKREEQDALPPPPIEAELLGWLLYAFPPRCYDPSKETLEDHLLYAGECRLIERLKNDYQQQLAEKLRPEKFGDELAQGDAEVDLELQAYAAANRED